MHPLHVKFKVNEGMNHLDHSSENKEDQDEWKSDLFSDASSVSISQIILYISIANISLICPKIYVVFRTPSNCTNLVRTAKVAAQ